MKKMGKPEDVANVALFWPLRSPIISRENNPGGRRTCNLILEVGGWTLDFR